MDKVTREEYLKNIGLLNDYTVAPLIRKRSDRRGSDFGSPTGYERRISERRSDRNAVGRERYIDMIKKEEVLFSEQGLEVTEQSLMLAAGVDYNDNLSIENINNASGEKLRELVPAQVWLPLEIHFINLESGILNIATLNILNNNQEENLKLAVRHAGFHVEKIKFDLWDRAKILQVLSDTKGFWIGGCETSLVNWRNNIDSGSLLKQFRNDLLTEGLQLRTSDIHLVYDKTAEFPNWIKYRIDGDLVAKYLLPAEAMGRLINFFKLEAGFDFADKTALKEGKISFSWQGRSIDIRIALAPHGSLGEKITLSLIDPMRLKNFNRLFANYPDIHEELLELLSSANRENGGLILFSGLTSSGKSTSLHASVAEIDRRRRHVVVIEDTMEHDMRYTTQWQASKYGIKNNNTAELIYAAMRHDADYIIISEMNDSETVQMALRAAEAGHMVISTINAQSVTGAIERIKSFFPLDKEKSSFYTLSQQLLYILNQNLHKVLCPNCKIKTVATEVLSIVEIEELKLKHDAVIFLYNENGCGQCSSSGFSGRTILLESLNIEISPVKRKTIYNFLRQENIDIKSEDGIFFRSKKHSIYNLVREGLIDPKIALSFNE